MLLVVVRAAVVGRVCGARPFRSARRDGARIAPSVLLRAVAAVTTMATMATMATMPPVPEHVHGHERHREKYPDPVLREPVHVYLLVVKSSVMTLLVDDRHCAGRRSRPFWSHVR